MDDGRAVVSTENSQTGLAANEKNIANFLLLGAPGQGNDAPDLTDTIIIARFDANRDKIFLFSLPRDLLVKIPGQNSYARINALHAFNKKNAGQEFRSLTEKTEEISGLKIDHYIFVNLEIVKKAIDILGGVNLLIKNDIVDAAFPGPNHSFQTFKISAGWRYLDGETALKYMRTRHSAAGDFDRIARQQEILQALKQKILTLDLFDFQKIANLSQMLFTDISADLNFWQMANYWQDVKNIPAENIIRGDLINQNLFNNNQILLGEELASIIEPAAGAENYEEIKKYIREVISE